MKRGAMSGVLLLALVASAMGALVMTAPHARSKTSQTKVVARPYAPPAPVRADFDHDGAVDIASLEPAPGGGKRLAVQWGGPARAASTVEVFPPRELGDFYLTLTGPGPVTTWCGKGGDDGEPSCTRSQITLEKNTLTYGSREASETVALWNGHAFEAVVISD